MSDMKPAVGGGGGSKACLIIAIVLGGIGLIIACACGGCLWVGYRTASGLIEQDANYQEAVERAENDARVQEKIGTPIEANFLSGGEYNNTNGNISMRVPISGPNGKGTLIVKIQDGSKTMEVEVDGETIDLLADDH